MKRSTKLSGRDIFMVVVLVGLLAGVAYYMGFYTPLQEEIASITNQANSVDAQITAAASQIARMDVMQAELDELFADPNAKISEIAPYDNKEVVLNQLNGILQASEQYSLNFAEPTFSENGSVRRNVTMSFSCADYASAKTIIKNLNESQWRCMVSNLSISGGGDIMEGGVSVSATITFFESTNLE